VPGPGEIIWVQFDPQAGREQAGHRPAVVLTPESYNRNSGLLICVPLTSRAKGYPFEVPVMGAKDGVALVDHVRSIDWRARAAKRKGRASAAELEEIRTKLRGLVG
jgi:mRNA interferase MazF